MNMEKLSKVNQEETVNLDTRAQESKLEKLVSALGKAVPVLICINDERYQEPVFVNKPEFKIGREEDCDLTLDHNFISRHHCSIIYENFHSDDENPVCTISDHSRNGTFVNMEKISGIRKLKHGDTVVLGEFVFGFFLRREKELQSAYNFSNPMEQFSDTWSDNRLRVSFQAKLKLLIPEDTFTPKMINGVVKDVSLSGMKFHSTEISEDYWKILMRSRHLLRSEIKVDEDLLKVRFQMRMAWLHYDNQALPPQAVFGLATQYRTEEEKDEFKEVLSELSKKLHS